MAFQGTLTGNLGMKPELKTFQSGKMKTELRVAVRQQDKDAPAFWVQVDLWDKSAQYAADYLNKGDTIYAQGTIKEENFTRRNGEAGHKVVLQFARIELLKSSTPKEGVSPYGTQVDTPPPVQTQQTNYSNNNLVPEVDEIPF
tara:strand:+ start:803 stop:1231 length:429 start_codon:yes stop_codon:yes gene_type:complete